MCREMAAFNAEFILDGRCIYLLNTFNQKYIKTQINLPISVVPPCWAFMAILASASLNTRDAAAAPAKQVIQILLLLHCEIEWYFESENAILNHLTNSSKTN